MSGEHKLNILINAYAVSPNWGSEPGMGWNWIINIAKYCNIFVITEGEWKAEILEAVEKLPQRNNIRFFFNPLPDKVRHMCWNQGDWRFYWYYAKWQKKTLDIAREIIAKNHIDIIHQLNMIGFREPGYLWQFSKIPFVWGPIGGMELMPMPYLKGAPLKQRLFNILKNKLNKHQYLHSTRVKSALNHASALISAVKGVKDVIYNVYYKESILINETGVEINPSLTKRESRTGQPLKIIWVGKFDFRKQLPIALRSIIALNRKDVELHICGSGSDNITAEMKRIAFAGGISSQCYWHGNIENTKVKRMMAESDLMFFTSIMEATSTVVLEAISVGLPVLCFNTCGFGPIVNDFAGITVDLSNPNESIQDFAIELGKIYDNREILNKISNNIISHRESLTWDSKAKKTIELYYECLNKSYK